MIRWELWGHTLSLELLTWVTIATLGAITSVTLARECWKDLKYQRLYGINGALRVVARGNFRRECIRMASQFINLYVGLYSFFRSPPVALNPPVDWPREIVTVGLLLVAAGFTTNSVLDHTERGKVHDLVGERRRRDQEGYAGVDRRDA